MTRRDDELAADDELRARALGRTVSRLYRGQQRLDGELSFFRRLHALDMAVSASFSLQDIMQQLVTFVTQAIGLERAALLLDDRGDGTFTVRATDGCPSELRGNLFGARVPMTSDLTAALGAGPFTLVPAGTPLPALDTLPGALGVGRAAVVALRRTTGKPIGLFAVGPILDGHLAAAARGTGPLAQLVLCAQSAERAINHCIGHWELTVERNLLEAKVSERTAELERAFERIQEDVRHARDFQQSILPAASPMPGVEIEIIYQPLELVGGDVYDIDETPDGGILLFEADATGHGVDAALTTMFIKSEYDLIKHTAVEPAQILRTLNESIANAYRRLDMRFTATCMRIDRDRRRARWASAGHPPPVLLRGHELIELDGGGPFVGMLGGIDFPRADLELRAGDRLCMFTDGVFEVWNEAGAVFGEQRAYAALMDASRRGVAPGRVLVDEARRFAEDGAFQDDLTFLGVGVGRA